MRMHVSDLGFAAGTARFKPQTGPTRKVDSFVPGRAAPVAFISKDSLNALCLILYLTHSTGIRRRSREVFFLSAPCVLCV